MVKVKKSIITIVMAMVLVISATACGQELPPADQTVSALFELKARSNAVPIRDLFGFESEQEATSAFMADGADSSPAEMIEEVLAETGVDMSEEDKAEFTRVMTNVVSKFSCTAEITSESGKYVEVTLQIYGYKYEDIADVITDALTKMQESITEEELAAIRNGDTDLYNQYMNQYVKDFIAGFANMEIDPDPVEVVVKCEKLIVETDSGKIAGWFPSDMDAFAVDVENACMHE